MFKTSTIIVRVAVMAAAAMILAAPAAAYCVKPVAKPHGFVANLKVRKAPVFKPVRPAASSTVWTATDVVAAIARIETGREGERAGYCAPVPLPRVGEQDGIFYNGFKDGRDDYIAAGFTLAKETASGAIYC